MVQEVVDRPNVTFSSSDAVRRWVSDENNRNDQLQDSNNWSWQKVVVTISSIAVLMVVAGVAVWKICQSATGTRSNFGIACCKKNKLIATLYACKMVTKSFDLIHRM